MCSSIPKELRIPQVDTHAHLVLTGIYGHLGRIRGALAVDMYLSYFGLNWMSCNHLPVNVKTSKHLVKTDKS